MLLTVMALRKYHSVKDIYTESLSTTGRIVFNSVQVHYSRRGRKSENREIYVRYRVDGKEYQREFNRKAKSRRGRLSSGKEPGSTVEVFYSISDPKFAYLNEPPTANEAFRDILYWSAFIPFVLITVLGYLPLFFYLYF